MSHYDESRQRLPDGLDYPFAGQTVDVRARVRERERARLEHEAAALRILADGQGIQIGRADYEHPRDWSDADALVDEIGREELTAAAALFTAMHTR